MNVLNAALYFEIGGDFGRLPLTWANHSVSGLVNFVRKRVCRLYKSVQFYGKRPWRPETGLTVVGWRRLSRFPAKMTLVHVRAPLIIEKISVWLWRNGTRIFVWNNSSGKTGRPFQMVRCSRKFSAGTTKKSCFIYFQSIFSGVFL